MVEQQARVINVEGDQLVLEAESFSSCNACHVKSGCGTSVLAKWVGRKFTRFNVVNSVNAQVGDQVVVGMSERALMSGSLVIYLWPLLGMIVLALAADFVLAQEAGYRDQIIAFSGVAGFVISLGLCCKVLAKNSFKEHLTPVVLRKIIEGKLSGKIAGHVTGHDRIAT
jgi:sigma-E factor negative regulatory protein RseC